MERIKQLLQSFSRLEVKTLKTYLTAFHTKGENKQLELISLIERNPDIDAEMASHRLYGDPRSKAFIMMKSRLYEKMTELLSLSVFNEGKRPDGQELLPSNVVEVRKVMLAGQELHRRRQWQLALQCFEDGYELAKKYGLHELELDSLWRISTLKMTHNIKKNSENGVAVHDQMSSVMKKVEVVVKAVTLEEVYMNRFSLRTGDDEEKIKYLESCIPSLEEEMSQVQSQMGMYYLNKMKIEYLKLTGKYDECKAVILETIDHIENNLHTENFRSRLSNLYSQLAFLELKFCKFEEARRVWLKTMDVTPGKGANTYFKARLLSLFPILYQNDLEESQRVIEELNDLRHLPANKDSKPVLSLLDFLQCIHVYKTGNVHKAWQMLLDISDLDLDKSGWITGIRALEVMFLVEMDEYDLVCARIENLRKHIERYPGDKRADAFQKLMSAQERIGFSFGLVKNEDGLLHALEQELPWISSGHEMIRYDSWYRKMRELKKAQTKS